MGLLPRPSHLISVIEKLIRRVILCVRYNQQTIAEYFRKQGAQIGNGCHIKIYSLGTEPYLVKIGNHVFIAEGVVFRNRDGGVWVFRDEIPDLQVFGPIIIEDNCIIGQDAILLPNVRIGRNSIVEPGSVVNSDIPPNSVVFGVPAKVIGFVNEYKERYINTWKRQRPPDSNIEEGHNWWTSKYSKENRQKLKMHLIRLFFMGNLNGRDQQQ